MKKYVIIFILAICCVSGYGKLYDNYLMPRFVFASFCLLALFVYTAYSHKIYRIPKSNIIYSYSAFIVLSGLSIIWSTNWGEAVFQECLYAMGFMVFMAFFNLMTDYYQNTKKMLWISSAIILIIYLAYAIIQIANIQDISFVRLYEVSGINTHKNHLAAMLFLLSSFLLTAIPEINHKYLKLAILTIIGVSLFLIVFLKSRAVILGLVISVVVFFVVLYIHNKQSFYSHRIKITAVFICIVLSFLFIIVLLRYITSLQTPIPYEKSNTQIGIASTSSLIERFILWNKTYYIVDKNPILGCGTGNWQICFPEAGLNGLHQADYWNVNFTKPHNEYLGVLVENGYVGLALYLTFICSLLVRAGFAIIETEDTKEFLFGAIIVSVACGSGVNAMFDFHNSRIEHLVWMAIIYAILMRFITTRNKDMKIIIINRNGNHFFVTLSILMTMVGIIRFIGEYETVKMQQALYYQDWNNVELYSKKSLSKFYSVDPVGMPISWYHGQSLKAMGNPQSTLSFRQAFKAAPFCKENLNDLGVDEYYTMGNPEKAIKLLYKVMHISPHYIYPYLNLTAIYIGENNLCKAKEVIEMVDFDDRKRDFLKEEARYFNPFSVKIERQKIDKDFEDFTELHHVVDSLLLASGISCD